LWWKFGDDGFGPLHVSLNTLAPISRLLLKIEINIILFDFQIEELPADDGMAVKSSFSSYSSNNSSDYLTRFPDQNNFVAKFDRPTELDLFGRSKRKQQGYLFNK